MLVINSMNKIFSFFKSISQFLALPILSGILVGTSYIPFNGWALLFCYIPLWIKILSLLRENKSLFQVFMAGWVSQFILTLIGFNWIYYVSAEFGHLPWFLSAGALFLYAAFMHIYIPLALVVAAKIIRRFQIQSELIQFIFIAICAGLLERIWPSIFEWNLAYTLLWIKFPLYQWADTVGFWGLSTWIFIMQAGLAYVIIKFKSQRKEALLVFAHVAIALALLTALGYYKGKGWSKADQLVRIAVTQGNIGNAEKIQSEKKSQFHSYIRGIYTGLTENLMQTQPADLVIWPETAMPFAFDQKYLTATEQKKLLASANQWGITIVTGAYSLNTDEKDHLNDSIIRNSIFYISPNFSYAAFPYYKTNLLAFGEYMPFGEVFPFLYKILPFVGTYAKGSGPVVAEIALDKKTLKLGPQMCYDSLAPGFSR